MPSLVEHTANPHHSEWRKKRAASHIKRVLTFGSYLAVTATVWNKGGMVLVGWGRQLLSFMLPLRHWAEAVPAQVVGSCQYPQWGVYTLQSFGALQEATRSAQREGKRHDGATLGNCFLHCTPSCISIRKWWNVILVKIVCMNPAGNKYLLYFIIAAFPLT